MTGDLTPAILFAAALAGGLVGALAARRNRVATSDELTLWIVAGFAGGALGAAEWSLLLDLAGSGSPVAAALALCGTAGLAGALTTPPLDGSGSRPAWAASFLVKWVQSPLATTAGIGAVAFTWLRGRPVDFRRGMLFVDVASGAGALALGAVGWCRNRCFGEDRCLTDSLARHEAVHSRTVAAVGELGFYLTYLTAGVLWARAQGGPWNSLNRLGCGQPLEKTAHTYTGDPATPCRCRRSTGRVTA